MKDMQYNGRYATACAALKMVSEINVFDCTADDMAFAQADRCWLYTDRNQARRILEAIIFGALDYVGYERFTVPAEFVAAAIFHFVRPVNQMAACQIMANKFPGADDMSTDQQVETFSAKALFAMVLKLGTSHEFVDIREDIERLNLRRGG